MKFAEHIENEIPGTSVVVDLTRQIEINNCGGLSQWIPKQMSSADKIVVVLSPEYLKVVEKASRDMDTTTDTTTAEENDQETLKVLMEYGILKTELHENCRFSERLVVGWLGGVDMGDLPGVFQGRSCWKVPTSRESFKKSSFLNVLSEAQQQTEAV